jgi:hypothetical protein
MKKNLTESFVEINLFGKFIKHVLLISLVLLSLNSCVNFRSGVHPKLVRNVKTFPTTTQGNLTKNDTLSSFVTAEITLDAKRSEVIPSAVLTKDLLESKNQFTDLKPVSLENTPANSTTKSKIKTNRKKLNASKPFKQKETNEEMDKRQSDYAFLFGILAIVSFFSIFLSLLIFVFCPLAFYNGRRVLKRGSAQRGSKEYRRAKFGLGIGAAFYIGWTAFFGILLILFLSGNF